jgi:GAF domain-containing protein
VLVPDALTDESFSAYRDVFAREGIGALAFVPLVNAGRLLGKFMVYYDQAARLREVRARNLPKPLPTIWRRSRHDLRRQTG